MDKPNGLKRPAPSSWDSNQTPTKSVRVALKHQTPTQNASNSTQSTPQNFSTPRSFLDSGLSPLPTPPPSTTVHTTPAILNAFSHSYHVSALSLVPFLARPSKLADVPQHRKALDGYTLLLWAAESCAKRAVEMAKDDREQLEARVRWAEVLVLGVGGGIDDVESVIGKGLSLACKHMRFASYRWQLEILQIEHAVQKGNLKFARERCKQCLNDLKIQRSPPSFAPIYHFYILLSTLHSLPPLSDYVSALSALKEAMVLAESRSDTDMSYALRFLCLRLKMCSGRWESAAEDIDVLCNVLGIPNEPPPSTVKMRNVASNSQPPSTISISVAANPVIKNQQLKLQILMLYCIFHSRLGNTKLAKERLKDVHQMLDEDSQDETDGIIRVHVHPNFISASASPVKNSYQKDEDWVNITAIPKTGMYSIGYLISAVIHRDAFGAKPQSKLYYSGGMKNLTDKLMGNGKQKMLSSFVTLSQVRHNLSEIARMKLDLGILGVELSVMRSLFSDAHHLLVDLVAFAQDHDLFDEFSIRFTLAEGTISHGMGKWKRAEECYLNVQWMCERPPPKTGWSDSVKIDRAEINLLACISLLVLKFGQGSTINMDGKEQGHVSKSSDVNLDLLAKTCIDRCRNGVAHLKLLGNFLLALINGEIVKAKIHLNEALLYSGSVINNHMRAMILSLLASLFIHTREDQANKMLHSAYFITRSMGCTLQPTSDILKGPEEVGDEIVGNAPCGLWVGERLLELYINAGENERAARQKLYNDAHEQAIVTRLADRDAPSIPLK